MKSPYRFMYLLCFCLYLSSTSIQAQSKILPEQELLLKEPDMQWFRDAKFGMFIHWGLYSIACKGEWAMQCLTKE